MQRTADPVTRWLFLVCGLVMLMVVVGGYVRLARAGLSIVEWNVITGIIPPIGEEAWQQEFAKYQQSPEYQQVNVGMTLAEYKRIYYIEYVHRLLARITGLIVVVPFLYFLWRGSIARAQAGVYAAIVMLFGLQGTVGWLMVKSGLLDRPAVSHVRLTIHLLLALLILALTLWTALNRFYYAHELVPVRVDSGLSRFILIVLGALVVQIAYGGFVAGLKAGYVSNTWPLMFGRWVPPKLFSVVQPWWLNLIETPVTVQFIHRWLARGSSYCGICRGRSAVGDR
ncbi:MAG: COX15/CtaA family protein [Ardenticatenia bacterium]|nr:COX15/CtaA family protein [Ardenticatenia bacterium]